MTQHSFINSQGGLGRFNSDEERVSEYFGNLKSKKKSGRKHEEDDLQSASMKIWALMYPDLWRLFFMCNNSGFKKRIETKNGKSISLQAIRDKRMGLVKGVSDTILWIPNGLYHAAAPEFKTEVGVQKEEQKNFEVLCGIMNYKYALIRNTDEFKLFIEDYMRTVDPAMMQQLKNACRKMDEAEDEKALKRFNKLTSDFDKTLEAVINVPKK